MTGFTDFDRIIDRRAFDSTKWRRYGPDILPMWVADMDFAAPPSVLQALRAAVDHGVLGYGVQRPQRLLELICERLERLYAWQVTPPEIILLPGLGSGLDLVCRAVGDVGDEVLVPTPVYPPFLEAVGNQGRRLRAVSMPARVDGARLHYDLAPESLATAVGPRSRLIMISHPQNPIGRRYADDELHRLAELALRNDLVILSDEVHCDLLLDARAHRPLATVDPEVAHRCITLMAPSKTYNIAGLQIGFAISPDPGIRKRLQAAMAGLVPRPGVLAMEAARAAYEDRSRWLEALIDYLRGNRDHLLTFLDRHLPALAVTAPESTYLAWIDCRRAGIGDSPATYFMDRGKVAFNDGAAFGPGGEGFVRLNFGCPRALLEQGLERMQQALALHHDSRDGR